MSTDMTVLSGFSTRQPFTFRIAASMPCFIPPANCMPRNIVAALAFAAWARHLLTTEARGSDTAIGRMPPPGLARTDKLHVSSALCGAALPTASCWTNSNSASAPSRSLPTSLSSSNVHPEGPAALLFGVPKMAFFRTVLEMLALRTWSAGLMAALVAGPSSMGCLVAKVWSASAVRVVGGE